MGCQLGSYIWDREMVHWSISSQSQRYTKKAEIYHASLQPKNVLSVQQLQALALRASKISKQQDVRDWVWEMCGCRQRPTKLGDCTPLSETTTHSSHTLFPPDYISPQRQKQREKSNVEETEHFFPKRRLNISKNDCLANSHIRQRVKRDWLFTYYVLFCLSEETQFQKGPYFLFLP